MKPRWLSVEVAVAIFAFVLCMLLFGVILIGDLSQGLIVGERL